MLVMNMNYNIAVIILAAGFSNRMGVFKPLLPVGGPTAVSRAIDIARSAGAAEAIVVTGHCCENLSAELQDKAPYVRTVHNNQYAQGMFSSVCSGVSNISHDADGFLLLPADCCAVSPQTIKTLIEQFYKTGQKFIIRPKMGTGSRGHPPLLPSQLRAQLCAYEGEDGLKGFLRSFESIELEVDDPGVNLDMDTPEDYEKLLNYLGVPAYPTPAQSLNLLKSCGTPPEIVAHMKHVAALALKIAGLLSTAPGININTELLESACLLHDIKRLEPNHAAEGKKFLLSLGYPQAAQIVGEHMDISEIREDIGESEILYLADKLCRGDKPVNLDETMELLRRKFSEDPNALKQAHKRMENAKKIYTLLKTKYGIGSLEYEEIM